MTSMKKQGWVSGQTRAMRYQIGQTLAQFSRMDAGFQLFIAFLLGFVTPWVNFLGARSLHLPLLVSAFFISLRLLMRPKYRPLIGAVFKQPTALFLIAFLLYISAHVVLMAPSELASSEIGRLIGKPVFLLLSLLVLAYIWSTPDEPYHPMTKILFGWGVVVFIAIFSLEILKNALIMWKIGWKWDDIYSYLVTPVLKLNRSLEVFSPLAFLSLLVLGRKDKCWHHHLLILWLLAISFVDVGVYGILNKYIRHINSESVQVGVLVSYLVFLASLYRPVLMTRLVFMGILCLLLLSPIAFPLASWVVSASQIHLPISFAVRLDVWDAASKSAFHAPLFGSGIDSYRYFAELFKTYGAQHVHPHNMFLQIWIDLGLVGIVLIGGLIGRGWRFVEGISDAQRPGVNAAISMLALLALTTHSLWQTWFMSLIALVVLLIHIFTTSHGDDATSKARQR